MITILDKLCKSTKNKPQINKEIDNQLRKMIDGMEKGRKREWKKKGMKHSHKTARESNNNISKTQSAPGNLL